MAEASCLGRTLPRETPLWLCVPVGFASRAETAAVASGTASSSSSTAEAAQHLQTKLISSGSERTAGGALQTCRRRWRDRDAQSTANVLAFSCADGLKLDAYSREADAFLERFFEAPLVFEIVDDSDWQKFPDVGAALRLLASKEECMTGAFCAQRNVWAFGVGMCSHNRDINAKVALATALALVAEGAHAERLSQYSQLASLASKACQKHHVQKQGAATVALDALSGLKSRCYARCASWLIGKHLCMSSPCLGSTVNWAQKRQRADGLNGKHQVSWDGFCVCCKRPLSLSLGQPPCAPQVKRRRLERYAYVCAVWGEDPQYVLGAMVLGHSLRQTGTQHDLIVMYTNDVPAAALTFLRRVGWHLHRIEYVEASEELFGNPRNRFKGVFTKLRVFELVEYSKVLLLDSDILVRENIDCLFELPAPAAMHRGFQVGYAHGEKIDGQHFFGGSRPGFDMYSASAVWDEFVKGPWSWGQATGINAGVMLFRPDLETLQQTLSEVLDGMHPEHIRGGGPEQDYLSRFYANDWTHISVAYNFQLHQMYFTLGGLGFEGVPDADRKVFLTQPDQIKIFHYSSDPKPWMRRLEPRFAGLNDAAWLVEVLSGFGGYRAYVLKDPDDVRWLQAADLEVPSWATEAAENVASLALRAWEQAYEELAGELHEPRLAHVVVAACGQSWKYPSVSNPSTLVHSRDNPTWDIPWSKLSDEQCKAAVQLGWNAETWDSHFWMLDKGLAWSDLSAEARSALETLGESVESYDRWESTYNMSSDSTPAADEKGA